jgi:hypothetical protein
VCAIHDLALYNSIVRCRPDSSRLHTYLRAFTQLLVPASLGQRLRRPALKAELRCPPCERLLASKTWGLSGGLSTTCTRISGYAYQTNLLGSHSLVLALVLLLSNSARECLCNHPLAFPLHSMLVAGIYARVGAHRPAPFKDPGDHCYILIVSCPKAQAIHAVAHRRSHLLTGCRLRSQK